MTTRPAGQIRVRDLGATTAGIAVLAVATSAASGSLPQLTPFLPVVFTTSVVTAVVSSFLLHAMARIQQRPALDWIATGNLAAAAAMGVQLAGFPGIAPGGGVLGSTPDGAAWLYLVWHVTIPLTVLAAVLGVHRRWQGPTVVATAAVSVLAAGNRWFDVPALFTPDLAYVRGLELAMGALTVLTFGVLAIWYRSIGDRPLGTEGWVAVSLTLHAFDVATHTFAQERFTALWWTSLGARGGQYVVLAIALLLHVTRLHGELHTYATTADEDRRRAAHEAETDFLTGLPNRRGYEALAVRALAERPGDAAVLVIDLDDFKAVNDTQGHDAGDLLLRQVAETLAGTARRQDLLCRWGGDEFVVLLVATTPREAAAVAARVGDALDGVARASVGCTTFVADGPASLAAAMAEADATMYETKRRRRADVAASV